MRAAYQAGDRQGIDTAYHNATWAAEAYEPYEDTQHETDQLYDQLTHRQRRRRR